MKVVVSGIPRGYQAPLPGGFWLTEEHRKKIEGVSPEIELVEIPQGKALRELPNASELVRRYVDMALAARSLSEGAQARREKRFRIEKMRDELENIEGEQVRFKSRHSRTWIQGVDEYRERTLKDFEDALGELKERIHGEMEKFIE